MLRNLRTLESLRIHCEDGSVGVVDSFLFDDRSWLVQYMVIDTDEWLIGRRVLVSPAAIKFVHWEKPDMHLNLTREQIRQGSDLDEHAPVSRQKEMENHEYYVRPAYWMLTETQPGSYYPALPNIPHGKPPSQYVQNSHLRSSREVYGYFVHGTDGSIGHVEDFLVEEGPAWTIRYLVVDTRNLLPGKRVIISPQWIKKINWDTRQVFADHTKDQIRMSPPYEHLEPVDRTYERSLHEHYGRDIYAHDD